MKKQFCNEQELFDDWILRNRIKFPHVKRRKISNQYRLHKEGEFIGLCELELLIVKAARLVEELGLEYIDMFERAEAELQKARNSFSTMERIKKLSRGQLPDLSSSNCKGDLAQPKMFLLKSWSEAVSGTSIFMSHQGRL